MQWGKMNTRLIGNRLIITRCPNGLKSQGEDGLTIKTVKTFPSKYAAVFKNKIYSLRQREAFQILLWLYDK